MKLAFLSQFCHWWHFNWGGGGAAGLPAPPPWLRLCAGQFVLEMRKLLRTTEAEFNSSIGACVSSKLSGMKAAVILAFRE